MPVDEPNAFGGGRQLPGDLRPFDGGLEHLDPRGAERRAGQAPDRLEDAPEFEGPQDPCLHGTRDAIRTGEMLETGQGEAGGGLPPEPPPPEKGNPQA